MNAWHCGGGGWPIMVEVGWPSTKPDVAPDHHGWLASDTKRLFADLLNHHTKQVVEIGSWLGLSARFILDHAPHAHLYCVDTWRGSPEHHRKAEYRSRLPRLYETFLVNVWEHRDRLTPVRCDSVIGMRHLANRLNVRPEMVYIDADHSAAGVSRDLRTALNLWPAARIVGDDWTWNSVRAGVSAVLKDRSDLTLRSVRKAWMVHRA